MSVDPHDIDVEADLDRVDTWRPDGSGETGTVNSTPSVESASSNQIDRANRTVLLSTPDIPGSRTLVISVILRASTRRRRSDRVSSPWRCCADLTAACSRYDLEAGDGPGSEVSDYVIVRPLIPVILRWSWAGRHDARRIGAPPSGTFQIRGHHRRYPAFRPSRLPVSPHRISTVSHSIHQIVSECPRKETR